MKSDTLPKQLIHLIENLNGEQLHALYRLVADRLNLVHKVQALAQMQKFNVLDRVSFTHNGSYYEGTVTRLNQKTITVILDNGHHWNVSPDLLTKLPHDHPFKEILTEEQLEQLRKKR